ncbi:MAG: homocysteine S-methyltransferase family protein [Gemmataceae bacterium]
MNKLDFQTALDSKRVLLMDGAMGSELLRAGLPAGTPCEVWNLTHSEKVRAIHRDYVEAGADCLVTNTFLASPPWLGRHGLADKLEEITAAAIELARQAAGPDRFVLASVGPLGDDPEYLDACLRRMLPVLNEADAILFETWSVIELIDVLRSIDAPGRLPWLVSFAYRPGLDPHSFELEAGMSPQQIAEACTDVVAALGMNCGLAVDLAASAAILRAYRVKTSLPLLVRPNAGTPVEVNKQWIYPCTAADFAGGLPGLLEAGAALIGGCCGSTPAHIAALRPIIDDWNKSR